jgi:hypothetical protein
MSSSRDQLLQKISVLYSNQNGEMTSLVQNYTDAECDVLLSFVDKLSLLQPRTFGDNVLPAMFDSAVFNEESTINLRQIPWELVTSFKCSEAGSVGVFFIRISNKTVVVKSSKSPQSELFAMALARHLNLSAPDARVVARGTTEWNGIASKIEELAKAQSGESAAANISSKIKNAPFLLIMQFVEGLCLGELIKTQADRYFSPSDPDTRKRFQDMGKLISFDMMVNNWDRFPYAWDNKGNIFNVMLQTLTVKPPGKVVGIDFSITPIIKMIGTNNPNQKYEDYFNRIESLVQEEIKSGPPGHFSTGLVRVANSFWDGFGYYPTEIDIMNLRIGILEGAVKISRITQTTLVNLLQNLPCPEGYDAGLWRLGSADVSLEFLEKAVGIFQKHANDADLRKAELRKIADTPTANNSRERCLIC